MNATSRPILGIPLFGMLAALALVSGCATNMKVPVRDPEPSAAHYVKPSTSAPVTLYFSDSRPTENKGALLTSAFPRSPRRLTISRFLPRPAGAHTVREMVARGLPVQLGNDASGPNTVVIKIIHIENRRVSGFSPLRHSRASVPCRDRERYPAYCHLLQARQVPVWSFNEVIDRPPHLSWPHVQRVCRQARPHLVWCESSDSQVDALIDKTNGVSVDFRDVYELGFSNNARAIPQLVKLCTNKDDEVHQAAFSSLGVLRDPKHFDLMVKEAENINDDWEDRAAALKGIGDLGTPESRAYLQTAKARIELSKDAESMRTKELIALYQDGT